MKQEGRAREVIQECIRALSIYPDDINLRQLLAECYLEVGFIGSAQKELEAVTSHIDDLIPVYKLQAENAAQQDRPEEALRSINVYLAHKPDDQEALDFMRRMRTRLEKSTRNEPGLPKDAVHGKDKSIYDGSDLSTPTLAEIYYNQGLIKEAIQTYENILANNPDDKKALKRLKELKAVSSEQSSILSNDEEAIKAKKKKMIGILEGWLTKIQEPDNA
jgi:tetratricopeptide (TPR) repeat protein